MSYTGGSRAAPGGDEEDQATNQLFNSNALGGSFALQTSRPLEWLFVAAALALLLGGIMVLRANGRADGRGGMDGLLRRVDSGAERLLGTPAWAAQPFLMGMWALLVAFIGFVWDVAWHADTGRDKELFTVPHTLIFIGLGGIVLSALLAMWSATRADAKTGWRIGRLRLPYSSVPLLAIGLGAFVGFPLDDVWHAAYGIDVTMWSPTHLMMIGGASLSPIPLWLLLSEAGAGQTARGRRIWASMAGVVLVGLSTFQLEFDMGIPQWQAFYHPLLVVAAMGIGLVAARVALGPWGAVRAAIGFVVMRALIALLVGVLLGHTLPRFPLYLGGALCVEAAFFLLRDRSPAWPALLSAALLSTAGLATEWAWTHLWFQYPWQPSLLPFAWMFVAMAVVCALTGAAAGSVLAGRRAPIPALAVVACLAAVFVLLGMNVNRRTAEPGTIALQTTTVGTPRPLVNRDGVPTVARDVSVRVTLDPPSLADGADWFDLLAWQGGSPVKHFKLVPSGGGRYQAEGAVPTGGNWKSLVLIHKGNYVEAVPLAMPADPVYDLATIDPPASRTAALQPSSHFLMREFRSDSAGPATAIFSLFGLVVGVWVLSTAWAFRQVGQAVGPPADRRGGRADARARQPLPAPG